MAGHTGTSERGSDKGRAGAPLRGVSSRLAPFGTTIFAEMGRLPWPLVQSTSARAFPRPGPELCASARGGGDEEGDNQYPPG